jgi:putative peptidoglycan lipid II flippase
VPGGDQRDPEATERESAATGERPSAADTGAGERDAGQLTITGAGERDAAYPITGAGEGGRPPRRRGRLALSTAFFSLATALSRVAGLVREVVAASYFGVTGAMSAFTIAFQVPNLVRALFADMALQGAFVPVFTDLLEQGRRREAFRVASSLFFLICLILGGLTALFVLVAPAAISVAAPGFDDAALRDLTIALARLMFPIVVLLGLSGLVVGMLNSFEHFSVPALAPLAWNLVIIGALVGLTPAFPEEDEIYAYAIGVLAGTVVQLVLPVPWLRGRGGRLSLTLDWRSPEVRRVLLLMLPVTITLGLINFSLLVNSFFGTLVSEQAPAAIDKAFRIYMLPQGIFSIAIATILFPTLSRYAARGAIGDLRRTMANGIRQIGLLLIPSAAIMAVLAEPITRLVYQRGVFGPRATDLVAEAMLVWAFSLPFQGASLLFSRTFFSIQRPWVTTALAGASLLVNALVALALYEPLGVGGVVLGTVIATIGLSVAQAAYLGRELEGIEARSTLSAALRMLAAAAALCAVSFATWSALDDALGRSLAAQVASVGTAVVAGFAVYAAVALALRIPEAKQIRDLVAERLPRRPG